MFWYILYICRENMIGHVISKASPLDFTEMTTNYTDKFQRKNVSGKKVKKLQILSFK